MLSFSFPACFTVALEEHLSPGGFQYSSVVHVFGTSLFVPIRLGNTLIRVSLVMDGCAHGSEEYLGPNL